VCLDGSSGVGQRERLRGDSQVSKRATGWKVIETLGSVGPYYDYLFYIGDKLGCHFTLEYRAESLTRKLPKIMEEVTNDWTVASIPALVSKLRRESNRVHDREEFEEP